MNSVTNIEKKLFQLLILVLAIICFVPGGVSAFSGLNGSALLGGGELIFSADSVLRGFADNQYRFGFGVFFTPGFSVVIFPE